MYFLLQKPSSGFYNFAFKFYLATGNAWNIHLPMISQHTQESDQKIISNSIKFHEYLNLAINGVGICCVL